MRGLYVHLPFCRSKCPYCGFYSETGAEESLVKKYLDACVKGTEALENKAFDTIYMGGGTPSSIKTGLLADFTEKLLSAIDFTGREFTVEANPESVSEDFAAFVRESPATRVSLGVQSLDGEVLKKLGRIHSGNEALKAAEKLLKTGVSLNTDMIFDIPGVSREIIFRTAEGLSALGHGHISAYSYSPEDSGYLPGFDPDETQYEEIENFFEEKGCLKYETSNFAKPGRESLHNIIYWTGDEYAGLGAGAHSMIYSPAGTRIRFSRSENIAGYIKDPFAWASFEELDGETALKETLIFGLRMKKGIDTCVMEKRFGKMPLNLLNSIDKYTGQGLLEWNSGYLRTTKRGALVLDYLSSCLWAC